MVSDWVCSSAVLGLHFTLVTALLTGFDLANPKWWRELQLSSTVRPPTVTWARVGKMLPVVLRNYAASALYVSALWTLRESWFASPVWQEWISSEQSLPGWILTTVVQLIVIHWLSQLWFWSAHWGVHQSETLFRYVHSAHHVHAEPFALTAIDCTVSEMLLLNIPAVLFPLLVVYPSLGVQCIWMVLAATHVPLTHSGHQVGHMSDAYHAIHHRDLVYNFGSTTLDKLFGTFKQEDSAKI